MSRSADRAALQRAIATRLLWATDPAGGLSCECCGVGVPPDTDAHHLKDWAAGKGRKRRHEPEGLRFLCRPCHQKFTENRLCECMFGERCSVKSCGG